MIKKVKEKYDKLAFNDYDKSSNQYYAERRSNEILKPICGKTLEVGAGTGLVTLKLLNKVCDIVAMDVSLSMLKVLLKKNPNVKVVVGDGDHLPFKNQIFVTVVASEMVYYLDNPTLFFNDVHRVLKENGSIVISAFSSLWKPFQTIRIALEKMNIIKVGMCDSYNKAGSNRYLVKKQLMKADFEDVTVSGKILLPFNSFHRINGFLEKTILEKIGFFFIAVGKRK